MANVQKKGQELGQLGQLGSPVLSKVKEAFLLLQGDSAQQQYTASRTFTGKLQLPLRGIRTTSWVMFSVHAGYQDATLFVGWNQPELLLVLTSTVHMFLQVPVSTAFELHQATVLSHHAASKHLMSWHAREHAQAAKNGACVSKAHATWFAAICLVKPELSRHNFDTQLQS